MYSFIGKVEKSPQRATDRAKEVFTMEELRTMSQIADELNLNRSKTWRIIQKLGIRERSMNGTAKLYTNNDFERIKAEAAGTTSTKAAADRSNANERPNDRTTNVQILAAQLRGKDELLAYKDEIIADLRQQLETMQRNYDQLNERFAETQKINTAQLIAMTRPKLLERIKEVFKPSGVIE